MKLRYFAWIRERIGKAEEDIAPPAGIATVGDLVAWLTQRGDGYAYAFENPKAIVASPKIVTAHSSVRPAFCRGGR